MQTLQIIFNILGSLAYVAALSFAITAYIRLRSVQRDIDLIERGTRQMFILSMGDHIQRNFEELQHMKEVLEELVENENYEEAAKLKATIDEAEESANRSLRNFKENFGEHIKEVVVTKTRKGDDDE